MTAVDLVWIMPVLVVLLLLKGFFSGSEIALVSADRIKLGHAAREGHRGARLVLELFRRPERVLTTTLVGTNLATVSLTTLGTVAAIHFVGEERGDLVAFLLFTPVLLVLGEVVPKAVYQQKADVVAPLVVYPLRVFSWVLAPLVVLFATVARLAARLAGAPADSESLFATREQLRALVQMAERSSGAQVFDRFRIERAIRFPDATVGERMVPAAEMVAIPAGATLGEAARLVRGSGHVHFPVYEGNRNNVVGALHLPPWDLMDPGVAEEPIAPRVQPAVYVSPSQTLAELPGLLQQKGGELGVVVDEYGSAMGLVTLEDVVEAVVGDLDVGSSFTEVSARAKPRCEQLTDGSYRMDARLPISEVNDLLGLDLPLQEFHTVGGLVTAQVRHLPRVGESVVVAGYRFAVEEASERAIVRIRVTIDRGHDEAPALPST